MGRRNEEKVKRTNKDVKEKRYEKRTEGENMRVEYMK